MTEYLAAVRSGRFRFEGPVIGFAFLFVLGLSQASAQGAPEFLAEHKAWKAYSHVQNGEKVCYIYSEPIAKKGNYTRRGNPYVMVTRMVRRQDDGTIEEVSVTSGYPYKNGTNVRVRIDGKDYPFGLIHDEHAWADDEADDKTLVRAMRKGAKMTVRGTSRKDTYSLDTYSLLGFTKARQAIGKACP